MNKQELALREGFPNIVERVWVIPDLKRLRQYEEATLEFKKREEVAENSKKQLQEQRVYKEKLSARELRLKVGYRMALLASGITSMAAAIHHTEWLVRAGVLGFTISFVGGCLIELSSYEFSDNDSD